MANLNLPDDQMREIVSAAILQTVTVENRDALITEAIANLIAPTPSGFGGRKPISPLQEAFNGAVHDKARQLVTEMLNSDHTFSTKVNAVITEAVLKAFNDEKRDVMINAMAHAIANAFRD
jgi:hypothetical protein